jgi:hypothetical protein
MKSRFLIPLVSAALLVTNCGADKAAKAAQQPNAPSAQKKTDPAARMDNLVGEWEMVGFVIDTNDNLQIDEAERRDLKKTMKDYMKLNRDGTGEFTVAKLPGRFETSDAEGRGKPYLTWYDRANGRHRIGTVLKVTREELHIKEPGGHGLFIWKRL